MKYALLIIPVGIAVTILVSSLATSFVFWDWQWFWSSSAGWRLFILLAIVGSGASAR
jgi:hypothetical protein